MKNKHPKATAKYNAYRNEYKKNIERARKQSWEDYKEGIDSIEDMNRFRKVIEQKIHVSMGALEKPDGSITDPGIDTLTHQKNTHFNQAEAM